MILSQALIDLCFEKNQVGIDHPIDRLIVAGEPSLHAELQESREVTRHRRWPGAAGFAAVASCFDRNTCRRRGLQIDTIDALLIQLCQRYDLVLLTTDNDFRAASRPVAFRLGTPA